MERGPGVTRPGPGTAGSSLLSGNRRRYAILMVGTFGGKNSYSVIVLLLLDDS